MKFRVLVGGDERVVEVTTSYRKAMSLAFTLVGWTPQTEGKWGVEAAGGRTTIRSGEEVAVVEVVQSPRDRGELGGIYRSPIPGRPSWNGWRKPSMARYLAPPPKVREWRKNQAVIVLTSRSGEPVGAPMFERLSVGNLLDQLPEVVERRDGAVYAYAFYFNDLIGVRDLCAQTAGERE